MKVLCINPFYWPAFQYGGPIAAVHELNKAMVKQGVNITVFTTNVGLENKVPTNQEVNIDKVKVFYFKYIKYFEFLGSTGWQFSPKISSCLRNSIKKFDIIYIPAIWNYPTIPAFYYSKHYGKPYIVAPFGTLYPYTFKKKLWKKMLYFHLIIKKYIHHATAIHYTTEDEFETCHTFLGLKNKTIVIPNAIDLSEFIEIPESEKLMAKYPFLKNKKVILYLGRITWIKGLDILIKAYAELAKTRKDIHLLIVGPDEAGYEKKVRAWCANYGILEKVTFTGILTGKSKLEAFTGSDLFVLPSYSENFGITVIEAMACRIPTIISNKVGIYREVEKNRAGIVIEADSKSLYNGIKTLLNNESLRKRIAENGEKLVKKYYDIDKVARQTIEVYKEILKNRTKK